MTRAPLRSLAVPAVAFLLSGCVTTEPVKTPPAVAVSGDEPLESAIRPAPAADLGMEVEANDTDSLEHLEVLPGVRVRSVAPGGPAARAGVATGDVVLSVEGAPTNGVDAFLAAALGAPGTPPGTPGTPGTSPPGGAIRMEVRRGTTVFEARLAASAPPAPAAPIELYRIDPVKLRAGFRTVIIEEGLLEEAMIEEGGRRRVAAEVVRILPDSPLEKAGIRLGERVVALSGEEIGSAQELVRRVVDGREFGERVTLTCLRDGEEKAVPVRLWSPPRRLTRLLIPILFDYEWKVRPARLRWSLLDLWVISLLEYHLQEGEREMRLLKWIRFRTGYGDLVEEPAPRSEE